jgi:hypothetical protein
MAQRAKKKKKGPLSKYLAQLSRKGGKARLQTMTEEERKESARQAAMAGWPRSERRTTK